MIITVFKQTDWISCGPVSLASAVTALGLPEMDFGNICKQLEVQGFPVGTDDARLTDPAIIESLGLKVAAVGEGKYNGGLAIINFTKTFGDMSYGHYALALGQRGDEIRYYDPEDGLCHTKKVSEINWVNGRGDRKNWAMCFDTNGRDFFHVEVDVKRAPAADVPLPHYAQSAEGQKLVVTFDQSEKGVKTIPADPRFLKTMQEMAATRADKSR